MQTTENKTNTIETLTAEQVDALIADAPAESPAAFVPTDAAGVDWVLGKMADARAQRIRENAELMARAEERSAEALEWKYGAALQTWLRAELAGTAKKSKRLFHGVLGYRQKPAGVSVTDPAAALSWAKENLPAAVTEGLDKKVLAEQLLSTGEALAFAKLSPAEDVFYIK
ncbi:MAG: hypothetical protein ACRYFS_08100 [Janthinobacterium lividum]